MGYITEDKECGTHLIDIYCYVGLVIVTSWGWDTDVSQARRGREGQTLTNFTRIL